MLKTKKKNIYNKNQLVYFKQPFSVNIFHYYFYFFLNLLLISKTTY